LARATEGLVAMKSDLTVSTLVLPNPSKTLKQSFEKVSERRKL